MTAPYAKCGHSGQRRSITPWSSPPSLAQVPTTCGQRTRYREPVDTRGLEARLQPTVRKHADHRLLALPGQTWTNSGDEALAAAAADRACSERAVKASKTN